MTVVRRLRLGPGLLLCLLIFCSAPLYAAECVVLLHGLARTSMSMNKIEGAFERRGYLTANVDYPSREHPIEELAPLAVEEGVADCREKRAEEIHFITHSLGGILVRYYLKFNTIKELGRVVMLAPPNQGSEVVDDYRDTPGYEQLNGPAGLQLGTDENSIPRRLGPVDFPLGVIAGTDSINLVLSQSLPNPDDGKVSLDSARVSGMADFLAMDFSHPFIMRADPVIEQALHFVEEGRFRRTEADKTGEMNPRW